MDNPAAVMARLSAIEADLEARQGAYESAARNWVIALRNQKKARAVMFLSSEGSVAERNARADEATALDGKQEEAEYVALKAVIQTLEARSVIGMSILRAQGRA